MKKTYIVALIMIAMGIGMMAYTSQNLSTYATFEKAKQTGKKSKIVGKLSLADPIEYDPVANPDFYTFYMIDENNEKRKVIVNDAKQRDFEKSEQVVVTGKVSGEGEFLASEVLVKCPSKYKDEELSLRDQNS